MGVRPGYKQTEVGVIPGDWDARKLGEIASIRHGLGFQSRYFKSHGPYRLTTPGHFYEDGGFRDIGESQKFYEGPLPVGYVLDRGSLIVAMTEQADGLLGSAALIPVQGEYLHNQRLGKVEVLKEGVSLNFLYRIFNSKGYRTKVRETAAGTKVRHTSPGKLLDIRVPLPPSRAEQEAIAGALSDADALIESLEQLLTKKRHLKQGAMQELLKPREGWTCKTLLNIAPLQRGFDLPNRLLEPGPYQVVYSNGVLNHHKAFMVKGPGLVTGRSGTLGVVQFIEEDFWPHNTTLWVTNFKCNDPKFIYYLYSHIGLGRFGTGSGVPTLNRNDVHDYSATVPKDLGEQVQIASTLSDMDAEIATLEAKLAKARQLKLGMMQELLTGRIRLV